MAYLIDSDVVIDYLTNDPYATALLDTLASEVIMISIFTYMEVYQGLLRSDDPEGAHRQFRAFQDQVPVVLFSAACARRCAQLRYDMACQGLRTRSRAIDLMTAAIAIEHGLTLVTRNIRDYSDVPGIRLYEW